jgi:hypothetical protein
MHIFVGGSLRDVPQDPDVCRAFVAALGTAIVRRGHVLLNGCKSSLDEHIATAANDWLTRHDKDPRTQIVSYCPKGDTKVHSIGTVRYSALKDWAMEEAELRVPEQIGLAGAAIFVAGNQGTFKAKNWASIAKTLILGVPRFGGSGEDIYNSELKHLRDTAASVAQDYETLNSLSDDIADYADQVVNLAERLFAPRSVFTIMSFAKEYRDVFGSYKDVCREFDFDAKRTDESTSLERIVPRIEMGIRKSAFVIADISEKSPNVFYEVGYARGLGKDVIVTARRGTTPEFDVADIPKIFWEDQTELKDGLRKYLKELVSKYGR